MPIIINDMYSSAACFVCDRSKNIECPRVKRNEPCGECKGTKYYKYADENASLEKSNRNSVQIF